jgi:hypothetical protein
MVVDESCLNPYQHPEEDPKGDNQGYSHKPHELCTKSASSLLIENAKPVPLSPQKPTEMSAHSISAASDRQFPKGLTLSRLEKTLWANQCPIAYRVAGTRCWTSPSKFPLIAPSRVSEYVIGPRP